MEKGNFTEGKILGPLLKFALPVIMALFLQSLYGAVDLLIVGQYASSADVSAVSSGTQIMGVVTNVIAGLSMGMTILLGQKIGEGKKEEAGSIIGAASLFFLAVAAVLSVLMLLNITGVATVMNAPAEAFTATCDYIRVCSAGMIFIAAYNLLGSLFRGIGNSKIPLMSVAFAAVFNIFGDLMLVKGMGLGAKGAAIATIVSQAFSVLISLAVIKRISLPFEFKKSDIRWDTRWVKRILKFGLPIALMDFMIGFSFLIIMAIVNSLGLIASAGVGVAGRVTGFILLIPSAFSQSVAAFVSQNYGAGKMDRAHKALYCGIAASELIGIVIAYFAFFHGDTMCAIFSKDPQVVAAGYEYMRAYAIDCILAAFFFCFMGYFNGCGYTKFNMLQGILSAFLIRIPVSFAMSRVQPVSLFLIGLATPCASLAQTIASIIYLRIKFRKEKESMKKDAA